MTHLAPELFQVGSKLTMAVDTFSFGIMVSRESRTLGLWMIGKNPRACRAAHPPCRESRTLGLWMIGKYPRLIPPWSFRV